MAVLFLLLIFIVCLAAILYYKYVYIYNKYLKCFPCPPEVPILGHALDFTSDKGILEVLMGYINNYGDTVRIKTGPKRQLLLTSNHKLYELLLPKMEFVKKSMDYKFFQRWLGTGLLTSEGTKWKKHRQVLTPTFHFNLLEDFLEVFESNSKILVEEFKKHLDDTSVDIYRFVNLCTLDIICETTMGTSVKAQENSDSEYVQSVKNMLDLIMGRVFTPHKLFDWIYFFTEDYKKEHKALKILHSHTWDVIKRRRVLYLDALAKGVEVKQRKALLDLLLELNINGQHLSLEEIREEVDTFMFAGHHATASAISFSLFCLANHPEEQAKVLAEQKKIFGNDFDRSVSSRDLKSMQYLDLFIKETLRLYPPGPFYSRELDHDVPYEGTILPKGLTITLFAYALHRNPAYFSEPEKFSPSRFENVDGKLPFIYLPFSAGPRNCIGHRFAVAEMKSVISRIVRTFELLPAIPAHELQIASQIVLISTNGVRIRFKKRNQHTGTF
jgi:cytochrome P450 family 4